MEYSLNGETCYTSKNVYFYFICCCTIPVKKSPLSSTRLLSLFIQLWNATLSSEIERGILLRHWCSAEAGTEWEGKLCPDSKRSFILCNDFKLTCSTFFFVLYSDMQDPQNVLAIISTKTLIWYNPMFVLYFVYQVLISKN